MLELILRVKAPLNLIISNSEFRINPSEISRTMTPDRFKTFKLANKAKGLDF